jgi:hypothetical protein
MATLVNAPAKWIVEPATQTQTKSDNIYNRILAFTDGQAKNRTLWYLVSLIVQGILFLPIPAALMYYFNAPIVVLGITMVLFFSNIIAGMGGLGIRSLMFLFGLSIIAHLVMLAVFIF